MNAQRKSPVIRLRLGRGGHDGLEMNGHRLGQSFQVIAAFQQAHQLSAAILAGGVQDEFGQGAEVCAFQSQRTDGIVAVGVEAGTQQNQLRPAAGGGFVEHIVKGFVILLAGDAERERKIENRAQACAAPVSYLAPVPG